jgi:hypothetical protein
VHTSTAAITESGYRINDDACSSHDLFVLDSCTITIAFSPIDIGAARGAPGGVRDVTPSWSVMPTSAAIRTLAVGHRVLAYAR